MHRLHHHAQPNPTSTSPASPTSLVSLAYPAMDAILIARQAAPTATPFPFPFQHTKMDLDWAVFMYIFVFCVFVGTILLGRIITCCTERAKDPGPLMV